MLNRNHIIVGLIVGLLLPILCWVVLSQIFSLLEIKGAASGAGLSQNFRERTLAIVAVAVNIIPLKIYQRRRWEDAMRGIVIGTAVLALVWVGVYGVHLF